MPSPPSTLVLSAAHLHPDTALDTRLAIVRRILRYVSPKPWGSISAIGNAKTSSHEIMTSRLWDRSRLDMSQFSVGGKVQWQAVTLGRAGELKLRYPQKSEKFYWLAYRSRPPSSEKHEVVITSQLAAARQTWSWLFDNRFLLTFDPTLDEPTSGPSLSKVLKEGDIAVRPTTSLFLPRVVLLREGKKDLVLAEYRAPLSSPNPPWRGVPWVKASFVRTLSML